MDITKFNAWRDKFVGDPTTPEGRAVNLAYESSMPDRVLVKGWNTAAAKQARKDAAAIIADFLNTSTGKTSKDLWDDIVGPKGLWDTVREIHTTKHKLNWYTYGNAQKWVAMSIKYYLFELYPNNYPGLLRNPLADVVFPVDRIMIDKIKNGNNSQQLSIPFKCKSRTCNQYTNCKTTNSDSWVKCDCKQRFKDYIDAVKNELTKFPTPDKLMEFEIDNW